MSEDPKGLLRQCAQNLLNAVTRLENSPSVSQEVPSTTTNICETSTPTQLPKVTAAEEHRRLFGYRPPIASSRGNRPPPPKRRMITTSTGQRISVPIRNTWSHTFVCLLKKNATSPPTAADKVNMALAGLEEKTITFEKGGNSDHVHEKILESFPPLANVGGYQILRTGERGNRQLIVITIPPGGYTVSFLKSTLASAKGYIRPFQKDIKVDHGSIIGGIQTQISIGPKVECVNCHQTVAMDSINMHNEVCCGGSSSMTFDEICSDGDNEGTVRQETALEQLQGIFQNKEESILREALQKTDGCVETATTVLLAIDDDDDEELLQVTGIGGSEKGLYSDIDSFKKSVVDDDLPRQRFVVSREDGMEELKKDILSNYKDNSCKLNAKLRVKFEGEDGVGSGPIREFLLCAIKIPQEGIGGSRRHILFFEGQQDHLVPVHDQTLRSTGSFRAIGRIIAHSFIHNGPLLYGLSPAVKRYWALTASSNKDDPNLLTLPASITIDDIPDIDLREYIQQLENLAPDDEIPSKLKEDVLPYLFEAGLDLDVLNSNRKHLIQGIMVHFVIEKRKRELDDLAKGMDEVGLHRFIGRCGSEIVESIFPMCEKQFISYEEIKEAMVFENSEGYEQTITYWHNYLACLSEYKPGQLSLTDLLCFWTATNALPPRSSALQVKLDDGESELPTAETCFNSITIPTKHTSYDDFQRNMDTALRNGSVGMDLS